MADTHDKTLNESLRGLLILLINDLKLTAAEKLSRLFTTVAVVFILSLLGLGVMLFLSFSMAAFFSTFLPAGFAYMIVAGVYLVFIVLVIVFRKQLFENPVTKLLSKLILTRPVHRSITLTPKQPSEHEK